MNLQSIFYNIFFIPAARVASYILRNFIPKLRQREEDALKVFNALPEFKNSKVIWFHAASMGEFEQAKPVIENIKENHPQIKVVCSFYSPSGYINQKNYKFADASCYILFDSKKNAKMFISKIKPDIAVFIRYDVWRNHLKELNKNGIPSLLINATFPSSKLLTSILFFKQFTANNYEMFNEIITINEQESKRFANMNIDTSIVSLSDTRFDRILQKVQIASVNQLLKKNLFKDEMILVAGSCWEEDEDLIIKAMKIINKDKFQLRVIFVPHEPTLNHINNLHEKVTNSVLLSKIDESNIIDIRNNHIIVDSIGKLLRIYSNADIAYVGGGFGVGIHSATEPAGYGIPVACGPNYTNSSDAVFLAEKNGLTSVSDTEELISWIIDMLIVEKRIQTGKINRNYLLERLGASQIISDKILDFIYQKQ